jgi:flagellar motor switch protein FliM
VPFDFRRPNTVSREHVRALQVVGETFARQFSTVLSTTLRAMTSVALASVEHVPYDEYVRASGNPTFLAVLRVEPLPGAGLLQIPLPLAFTALDRMLGGTGLGPQPVRELTELEVPLVREVATRSLRELDYALEPLAETRSSLVGVESNPQFAQVCAPSDAVVQLLFDVRLVSTEATVSLCLPVTSVQPLLEAAAARSSYDDGNEHDRVATSRALASRLSGAPVDVAVRFDAVRLPSREIVALRPGDVLPLGHPVSAPLTVLAAGKPCASAVPGSKGRRLAFLVVPTPPEDPAR